jgi:aminoglycoside phosphotransferase (APT) family kinase protein
MNGIAESRPLRPIHGDMDANQWLDDGVRLGLTDFDDFSLGDPELDAATFLAELEVEDQPQLPFDQLAEAFLEGYESVGGPLDHSLLSAYLAHKRLFKALRSARALRQDGDVQAERHLVRAQHCISKMNAQVGCWREATVSR